MTILIADPAVTDGGFPFGQTVTRIRAALVTDPYTGQATKRDWPGASRVNLTHVQIAPASSTDVQTADGTRVVSAVSLWSLAIDLDVVAQDRIEVAGQVWEVDGDGARWSHPFTGWQAGAEFPLRRLS